MGGHLHERSHSCVVILISSWRLPIEDLLAIVAREPLRIKHTMPRDPAVDAYVSEQKGSVGETTRFLVDLVRATVNDSTEAIYHASPKFCVADGRVFCYVAAFSSHVNLGFIEGAMLAVPDGLLEGTGKGLRHVKVLALAGASKPKLVRLIQAAATRAAVPA